MAFRVFCVLSAFLLANPVPPGGGPEPDVVPDSKKIQGTWEVADVVHNGESVIKRFPSGLRLVFAGDKGSLIDGQEDDRNFTFKLDHTKKPKEIDITAEDGIHKGETTPAIYQLDGNHLLLCQSNDTKKIRPTEFAAPKNSSRVLFTLKRSTK